MHATLRKWLIGIGLLVLVVLTVLIAEWQYTLRRRDPRLDAIRAKLDETEPGWQLDEIVWRWNESVPPAEVNLADNVREAVQLVPRDSKKWEQITRFYGGESVLGERISSENRKELTEAVQGMRPVLLQLLNARKFTAGGTKNVPSVPYLIEVGDANDQKYLARHVLDQAILLEAHHGRGDEAIDLCRTQIHLRRVHGGGWNGFAHSQFRFDVTNALRNTVKTLNLTEPRMGLGELQFELTEARSDYRPDVNLKAQRAYYDRLMQRVTEGRIDADQFFDCVEKSSLKHKTESYAAYALCRRYAKSNHAIILEKFTAARDAMGKNGIERRRLTSLPIPKPWSFPNMFAHLIADGLEGKCLDYIDDEAQLHSTIVAIACERQRQRTGDWPVTLDVIPKDILPSTPNDPFTDAPVKYRKCEKGIVVYSVGRNGVDEAGRNLEPNDNEEIYIPGDDVGVFLFSPNFRARPPRKRMDDNPE